MMAEEGDGDGFQVPCLVSEWKMGCPKSQCGRVKAKLGRRMKMRLVPPLVKAMCAMMRCTSLHVVGLHVHVDKILFS